MKNEEKKEIKYFSMFTGVGGFELGFSNISKTKRNKFRGDEKDSRSIESIKLARQQFTCVGFSEIDKYASELLKQKFPNIKNYGDATKINPTELPDFNLLVGGFPCQAFSIAGKRKGFEDTRGTLFHEIVRILEVKRPGNILLENVKGLLSHDRGRTFAIILASLSKLGYVIQWVVLNSKFFGVPQNRERVFIIGSLTGEPIPEILPLRESSEEIVGKDKHKVAHTIEANYWKGPSTYGSRTMINVINNPRGQGFEMNKRIYGIDGIAPTLQSQETEVKIHSLYPRSGNPNQGGTGHLSKEDNTSYNLDTGNMQVIEMEGMKIRRLTPIECERLQGFPDNWTEGFSDTQRYKMMGNAVTVNVIKAIGEKLIK